MPTTAPTSAPIAPDRRPSPRARRRRCSRRSSRRGAHPRLQAETTRGARAPSEPSITNLVTAQSRMAWPKLGELVRLLRCMSRPSGPARESSSSTAASETERRRGPSSGRWRTRYTLVMSTDRGIRQTRRSSGSTSRSRQKRSLRAARAGRPPRRPLLRRRHLAARSGERPTLRSLTVLRAAGVRRRARGPRGRGLPRAAVAAMRRPTLAATRVLPAVRGDIGALEPSPHPAAARHGGVGAGADGRARAVRRPRSRSTPWPRRRFPSSSSPVRTTRHSTPICDVLEERLGAERAVLPGAGHSIPRAPGLQRAADTSSLRG